MKAFFLLIGAKNYLKCYNYGVPLNLKIFKYNVYYVEYDCGVYSFLLTQLVAIGYRTGT